MVCIAPANNITALARALPSQASRETAPSLDKSYDFSNSSPSTLGSSSYVDIESSLLLLDGSRAMPPNFNAPDKGSHVALPDILDASTAANICIRHICCKYADGRVEKSNMWFACPEIFRVVCETRLTLYAIACSHWCRSCR